MMTPDEFNLIDALFARLSQLSTQVRDPEAERLIQSKVAENPHAPYQLVQSTLVLQQAVAAAQSRIAALEKQITESAPSPGGGSFLSGVANLFGAPQSTQARPSTPPPIPAQPPVPTPVTPNQGGGFLQTALSTAAGVAGGALLFQGIENLLGHNPGPFSGMGGVGGFGGGQPVSGITNNSFDGSSSSDLGMSEIDPKIAPIDPDVDFTSLNPGVASDQDASLQDGFTSNDDADSDQSDGGDFFGGDDSSMS